MWQVADVWLPRTFLCSLRVGAGAAWARLRVLDLFGGRRATRGLKVGREEGVRGDAQIGEGGRAKNGPSWRRGFDIQGLRGAVTRAVACRSHSVVDFDSYTYGAGGLLQSHASQQPRMATTTTKTPLSAPLAPQRGSSGKCFCIGRGKYFCIGHCLCETCARTLKESPLQQRRCRLCRHPAGAGKHAAHLLDGW